VVYHGNYLVCFEIGRTKIVSVLGLKYTELVSLGYYSPVIYINIHFKKPLPYGQVATVKKKLNSYNGIRTLYDYEIYDKRRNLTVTGKSTHVVVRKYNFTPVLMRKVYPHWHQAFIDQVAED